MMIGSFAQHSHVVETTQDPANAPQLPSMQPRAWEDEEHLTLSLNTLLRQGGEKKGPAGAD